jgi:hypothetical protein
MRPSPPGPGSLFLQWFLVKVGESRNVSLVGLVWGGSRFRHTDHN